MDIKSQYEAFGLEMPEEGVNEQETAEPVEESAEEGVNEQEVADPVGDEDGEDIDSTMSEQSKEERSKYAAARRKAESALAEANKERDALRAELERLKAENAKREAAAAEKTKEDLSFKYDIPADEIESFISALPEVQRAKEIAEQAKKSEFKTQMDAEISKITEIDPTIKDMQDVVRHPSYNAIRDCVSKGYSLSDAYKLINLDSIIANAKAATKQQTLNNNNKEHLSQTKANASGVLKSVPADIKAQYKMFNPGLTDEQIAAHYNKNHKGV